MAGKADIVDHVAQSADLSKKQAADALDAVFAAITEMLTAGDRVQVSGFGSFSISERASREGRNPATGETITIAASKLVRFKAGKSLKDSVNS
jgi:DNA-binding protein HU-beta